MRATVTFALIKSLYDDNQDLLTVLRPFFLASLEPAAAKSDTEVQSTLLETQAIDLPIHVIQKCGESARAQGLVTTYRSPGGERQYTLTGAGAESVLGREALSDVKRRVRQATTYLADCIRSRGVEVDQDEVDSALRRLIARNLETVVGFVVAGGEADTLDVRTESAIEAALAECVAYAAHNEPQVYQTLRDLVYGSVVLATISQADDQIIEAVSSTLDGLVAYADTNWVLGVLELDTPARNLAASELLRLAKRCGVEIRMLDFVRDETAALLKFYEDEYDTGRLPLDPGSVFTQMKLHGKRPGDILLLRTYLDDTLLEYGISVEETGVVPRKFKPANPEHVDKLMHLKQEESPRRTLVDLAAIAHVETQRGGKARDLETSKYVLLSCDGTLARFNLQQMGHQEHGSYSEVILDKSLTTILWLKNPGLDIPLETVVAAHSRGLLHRQAVWFQVVRELSAAASAGTADPRDISIFLSSDGPDLIAESVTRLEEITPQFVRQMVDEAKAARESEIEAVRAAVAVEGQLAVDQVRQQAQASIEKVQAEALKSTGEARGETAALERKLSNMEASNRRAQTELQEEAKTRGWIAALVVVLLWALSIAVLVLVLRASLENWFGEQVFRTVVVPLTIGVMTVGGAVMGPLGYRITTRRGDKRLARLFVDE